MNKYLDIEGVYYSAIKMISSFLELNKGDFCHLMVIKTIANSLFFLPTCFRRTYNLGLFKRRDAYKIILSNVPLPKVIMS